MVLSSCDTGNAEGITCVLSVGVNIFSILVGILAVIGIIYAGIKYITANGDVAQVTLAKRRITEIVIGIAVYVLIYAFLGWLLPTFPR